MNLNIYNFPIMQRVNKEKIYPFKMVFGYVFFAQLWILLSDGILLLLIDNLEIHNKIQTYKGTLFIIVSAVFIYRICSTISNIKQTSEELNKAIYEKNEVQELFFSNLAHDLKTPLNLIFSSIQMLELKWSSLDEKHKKYISIIRQNSYRLIKLINNIVDITKYDSGIKDIKLKSLNIVGVVEEISFSVVDFIESKGLKFVFDTEIEEKLIYCDPDKIERIMLNLLSNSVKFTKEGGIISVNIYDKTEYITISVKDTGEGMTEESQKSIFQRFVQVNDPNLKVSGGSGIGLSVVKSLVEMHNGTITCKSEYKSGSEFIIDLPVKCELEESNKSDYNIDLQKNTYAEKINIEFSDIY